MKNNKLLIVLASLGLYLLSAGISYSIFSGGTVSGILSGPKTEAPTETGDGKNDYERLVFDESLPKTEECPLNGKMYSKQHKEWWEKHRPLGVMIENHQESRPQSGLSFSDVIYEAVAEGGITRFLSVYYCDDAGLVGPVRSARTYFLDFISEYGDFPIYSHQGGANCNAETGSGCANGAKADAAGQIKKYGWYSYNDIDGLYIGLPVYKRDESRLPNVATKHTVYSTTTKLWKEAKDRGLTEKDSDGNSWDENFREYKFQNDIKESERPVSQKISIEFWSSQPNYNVTWSYDSATNAYLRTNANVKHLDNNTDEQLAAKNVVILYMQESNANDGYPGNLHLLYGTKGKGDAVVFQNGEEIEATWSKADRESRTILTDSSGKEISFTRGKIWFTIVPTDSPVVVN